jgi:hypothetical protein
MFFCCCWILHVGDLFFSSKRVYEGYFDSMTASDLVLKTRDAVPQEFKAHKMVLMTKSKVFKACIEEDKDLHEIEMEADIELFLRVLYDQDPTFTNLQQVGQVYWLAYKYGCDDSVENLISNSSVTAMDGMKMLTVILDVVRTPCQTMMKYLLRKFESGYFNEEKRYFNEEKLLTLPIKTMQRLMANVTVTQTIENQLLRQCAVFARSTSYDISDKAALFDGVKWMQIPKQELKWCRQLPAIKLSNNYNDYITAMETEVATTRYRSSSMHVYVVGASCSNPIQFDLHRSHIIEWATENISICAPHGDSFDINFHCSLDCVPVAFTFSDTWADWKIINSKTSACVASGNGPTLTTTFDTTPATKWRIEFTSKCKIQCLRFQSRPQQPDANDNDDYSSSFEDSDSSDDD